MLRPAVEEIDDGEVVHYTIGALISLPLFLLETMFFFVDALRPLCFCFGCGAGSAS